jgi:hypothetical protein
MTQDDLLDLLPIEMKGLSKYLVTDDYENSVNDASRETGWSFPISGTDSKQTLTMEYWIKTRSKRHLFFYLMSESAHKFKYDVISLDQRFLHYKSLIDTMDKEWNNFIADNPELFITNAVDWFCTKIDAGFAYDDLGVDISYDPNVPVMSSDME